VTTETDALLGALADLIAERVAERLSMREREGIGQRAVEKPQPDFYGEIELARRIGLSRRTLQSWRQRGGGPLWVKAGRRVLYPRSDTEAFFQNGTGN
jgi:hypothetical protein